MEIRGRTAEIATATVSGEAEQTGPIDTVRCDLIKFQKSIRFVPKEIR